MKKRRRVQIGSSSDENMTSGDSDNDSGSGKTKPTKPGKKNGLDEKLKSKTQLSVDDVFTDSDDSTIADSDSRSSPPKKLKTDKSNKTSSEKPTSAKKKVEKQKSSDVEGKIAKDRSTFHCSFYASECLYHCFCCQ